MKNFKLIIIILCLAFVLVAGYCRAKDVKKEELVTRYGNMEAGIKLMELKRYSEALDCFKKVQLENPKDTRALLYEAMALYWLEEFSKSNVIVSEVLKKEPYNYMAWLYKGKSVNGMKNPREALGCFERAIEIKPDFMEAWYHKAMALYGQEQYRASLASLNRVLAKEPGNAKALVIKGMCHYWLGDISQARLYIQKGLALDGSLRKNIPEHVLMDLNDESLK
ncbi:MAG: tetratricopeptide repeat protein [Vulcanimicrobiota bacterium]